jgi:hypothetical protein
MALSLRAAAAGSLVALVLAAAALPARAEDRPDPGSPPPGRETSQEQEARRMASWVRQVTSFTRGVEIDEADVQSYLEHFESFQQLLSDDEKWNVEILDRKRGFEIVVRDPRYVRWAGQRGLDPDGWLRKSMRILLLSMADEMEQAAARNLEESRKKPKPEGGVKGRPGRAEEEALAAVRGMPRPAAKEQALLTRHGKKLKCKAGACK